METSHTDVTDQNPGGTNTDPTPEVPANTPAEPQQPSDPKQDQPQTHVTEDHGTSAGGSDTADEQLQSFAKGIGISADKLKDPDVLKVVRIARDNKAMSDRNYQQAQDKDRKVREFGQDQFKAEQPPTPQPDEHGYFPDGNYPDPNETMQRQLDSIQHQSRVANFFALNPEAKDYIDTMDSIAKDKPYLYNDLPLLYEVAQTRSTSVDSAKDAGRREERERLAGMQQASAPAVSASNSAPESPRTFTRGEIHNMSMDEYQRNRAAIVQAEREGRVKE